MKDARPELTLATEGHMLENWRAFLTEDYKVLAPWWLAGGLEEYTKKFQKEMAKPWFTKKQLERARADMRRVG